MVTFNEQESTVSILVNAEAENITRSLAFSTKEISRFFQGKSLTAASKALKPHKSHTQKATRRKNQCKHQGHRKLRIESVNIKVFLFALLLLFF